MLQESASALPSSIWASINSWFTPTVLFVLLNLVIATIAFTSTHKRQQTHHVPRSPSLLHRLKSINNFRTHFRSTEGNRNPDSETLLNGRTAHQAQNLDPQPHYFFPDISQETFRTPQPHDHYFSQHNAQETQAHLTSECNDIHEEKVEENNVGEVGDSYLTGSHFSRTKSDTEPASGRIPEKLPTRMRKSASLKSAFGLFKEEDIVEERRPATVREKGRNAKVTDGDEEVDAKADDFINRFKQQLKLQRSDSIIRYKDMIGRGSH